MSNASTSTHLKEIEDKKNDLLKIEAEISHNKESHASMIAQVEAFPETMKRAVLSAEELLRSDLIKQHNFEIEIKQKEYEATLKLNQQQIAYLEAKIKEQNALIKELTEKSDSAIKQVEAIACKALDSSQQRFSVIGAADKEK